MATIKFTWNKLPSKVIDELLQDVKATAPKVLEAFSKEVEVNARRNFNRAVNDISGDNPYVSVVRTVSGNNATITCMGEQVLFAEFGAGLQNRFIQEEKQIDGHYSTRGGTTYYVQAHVRTIGLNARGFRDWGNIETMPRPAGIVYLGEYGKGWGVNEFWVRPTQNGRMANRETHVHKTKDEIKPNVVWTMGTKPVRALYRARNTAINKLASGRLKIK